MNTFLAITYSFFLSWVPMQTLGASNPVLDKSISEHYFNATHVEFQLGLDLFNAVHLYTGEGTYQVPDHSFWNWEPYRQIYWLGIEYYHEFNDSLNLKAGVNHRCSHPVSCWSTPLSVMNDSATEVYIEVSGKLPLF